MADELKDLKAQVSVLEQRLQLYEQNGAAKLYYSLNRKMNEMADLLNSKILKDVALEDAKDKTFDRMKIVWNDSVTIATAVKALGELAGVTGDEKKDVARKPFLDTIAEKRP